MNENTGQGSSNLIVENRQTLVLTGVTDVDSFDEGSVMLYTELGELVIKGRKLHINTMNVETGDLSVEGDICALIYGDRDQKKKATLIGKLFK